MGQTTTYRNHILPILLIVSLISDICSANFQIIEKRNELNDGNFTLEYDKKQTELFGSHKKHPKVGWISNYFKKTNESKNKNKTNTALEMLKNGTRSMKDVKNIQNLLKQTVSSLKYQNSKSYYTLQGYSHSYQGWLDPFAAFYSYDFLNLDFTL